MTKSLVLGYSGFIGRHLWRALSEKGHSLVGVGSSHIKSGSNSVFTERAYSDHAEMLRIIGDMDFDYIFLSSNYFSQSPTPSPQEKRLIDEANLVAPLAVVRHVMGKNTIVCNLGSFWALPGHRNHSLPYAQSKAKLSSELERIVNGPKFLNLYLTDTFGTGDRRGKVVQKIIEARIQKSRLELRSPSTVISISHVADLVSTIVDSVLARQTGNFLVVGSHTLRLRDLLKATEHHSYETISDRDFIRENLAVLASNIKILRIESSRNLLTAFDEIEADLNS